MADACSCNDPSRDPDGVPGTRLLRRECAMLAQFFSIFGHPTRMAIFCELQDGPKTVTELAECINTSLQNMSQHLRIMRDKAAVTTRKEGQCVYYRIVDDRIVQGAHLIRDALIEVLQRRAGGTTEAKS